MKKLFFLILFFVSIQSFGQRFPSVDSLQNYILRYVRNSTVESFTNLRMQNVVYGLSELLESRAVDSIWRVIGKDSIFFRKNGATFAIKDSTGSTLPSQTGNNGKYLTTNGSVASWGTPANFANTNLTFTGNRTHNAASNDLTFTNLAYWDNFSTERFYFEGSDGTSTGSINTGKSYVGLSRTTTGGKNSYIAINQNGNNEFQIGAYRTGANSNTYFLPDSIQTNKPIQYAANYGSLFNQRSLVDKRYVDSIITGGGSLNLQQVTDNGATTTNNITISNANASFNVENTTPEIFAGFEADNTEARINIGVASGNVLRLKGGLITGDRIINFPNKSGTLPLSVRLNGTTYTSNDTGSIELGTITGGISDTSRIVTIDKTQTITGRKTFNGQTFFNKDSVTRTTGKIWGAVIDTTNGQLQRQILNTGSGSNGQVTYWNGTNSITSNSNLQTNGSNLGIGGAANASAAFDVTSTTQGTRPFPTMTTTQRNAISSPATGLLIFNSTDSVQQYYNGASWIDLADYRVSRRVSNKFEFVEEFVSPIGATPFTNTSSGTGANFEISLDRADSISTGAARIRVGNAASTALGITSNSIDIGFIKNFKLTNPLIIEFRAKADTCNATDTLNYIFGFGSTGAGNASIGARFAGFIYDPRNTFGQGTSGSRNIWFVTRSVNNSTTTNTNIIFTPNTYQKFKIIISSTYALAYINDVLVATHTTNIPSSSDNTSAGFQFYFRSTKTVTSSNTVMSAYIDYWSLEHYFDTKR